MSPDLRSPASSGRAVDLLLRGWPLLLGFGYFLMALPLILLCYFADFGAVVEAMVTFGLIGGFVLFHYQRKLLRWAWAAVTALTFIVWLWLYVSWAEWRSQSNVLDDLVSVLRYVPPLVAAIQTIICIAFWRRFGPPDEGAQPREHSRVGEER